MAKFQFISISSGSQSENLITQTNTKYGNLLLQRSFGKGDSFVTHFGISWTIGNNNRIKFYPAKGGTENIIIPRHSNYFYSPLHKISGDISFSSAIKHEYSLMFALSG